MSQYEIPLLNIIYAYVTHNDDAPNMMVIFIIFPTYSHGEHASNKLEMTSISSDRLFTSSSHGI